MKSPSVPEAVTVSVKYVDNMHSHLQIHNAAVGRLVSAVLSFLIQIKYASFSNSDSS